MFRFLGKVLLSLIITNWVYSEAVIFYPQVHTLAVQFARRVRIPTHDEWPGIAQSSRAKKLRASLEDSFSLQRVEFFGSDVSGYWSHASHGLFFRLLDEKEGGSFRQVQGGAAKFKVSSDLGSMFGQDSDIGMF